MDGPVRRPLAFYPERSSRPVLSGISNPIGAFQPLLPKARESCSLEGSGEGTGWLLLRPAPRRRWCQQASAVARKDHGKVDRPLGHRGSSPLGVALRSDGARGAADAFVLVAPSQQTAFARFRYTAAARTWVSRSRPNRGSGWAEPPCPAVVKLQRLVPKSGLPTARSLRSHRQGASLNTSSRGTLPSFIVIDRHGLTTNCRARALVTRRKRSLTPEGLSGGSGARVVAPEAPWVLHASNVPRNDAN